VARSRGCEVALAERASRRYRSIMHAAGTRVIATATLTVVTVCVSLAAIENGPRDQAPPAKVQPTGFDEAVDRDIARVRAATETFKSLDKAVAAGYSRDGGRCVDNPPEGGMGFHHQNGALLDARLEIECPEMLVYQRLPDGTYRLNGVEYIVPYSAWPETREPPTIMGQKLKPAPQLQIWYRHVWIWLENPSGLFADWHPQVKC
jgi:hypothetical protein